MVCFQFYNWTGCSPSVNVIVFSLFRDDSVLNSVSQKGLYLKFFVCVLLSELLVVKFHV